MQSVDIFVNQSILADTFNSMREWLDHYNSALGNFTSNVGRKNTVILHAVFAHADEAAANFDKRFNI